MGANPTAETRAEWLNYYEFYNRGTKREGQRVCALIEQVERLTVERDGVWAASVANLAESQAEVKALTKQLDEARVVMRHYVDHVRSHGHADSDAEAMEILLGAWAEEAS